MKNCKELLLCLSVLCLLFLLFIGAVSRQDAKQALCADNLRQILCMMQNYADTHGVMPPVWTVKKPLWTFWYDNLDPQFRMHQFAACPSDLRNAHMYNEKPDPLVPQLHRIAVSSYGMNERMHMYNNKRRATMHNFADPENLIIFGDAKVPMLMVVQNPGVQRHNNRFHYITPAGNIRLYTEQELGGRKSNGHFNVKNELWTPWRKTK